MEEKKKKLPLTVYEIVITIVLIPFLFYYALKSFNSEFFGKIFSFFPNNTPLVFLYILGFDLIWLLGAIFIPKYQRLRIYSTLFIITISLAILAFWIVMTGFGEAMH